MGAEPASRSFVNQPGGKYRRRAFLETGFVGQTKIREKTTNPIPISKTILLVKFRPPVLTKIPA